MAGKSEYPNGVSSGKDGHELKIPLSSILRSLQGVVVATKATAEDADAVKRWLHTRDSSDTAHDTHNGLHASGLFNGVAAKPKNLKTWYDAVIGSSLRTDLCHIAIVALIVAFLREKCRRQPDIPVTPNELTFLWENVRNALIATKSDIPIFTAMRSAQGFIAVPLCSIIKDGNIDELWRFHVWLPDGRRGKSEYAIHSHQPYSQSWILAGQGTDHCHHVEQVDDRESATHAEYALNWNDGKNSSTTYKTHQKFSVVSNTGQLVQVTPTTSATHARNMTYEIPEALFHRSEVAPNLLHATIFFFDSSRGFFKDARVLGPPDGEAFIQHREVVEIAVSALGSLVETVREWEVAMEEGEAHAQGGEWGGAIKSYERALALCNNAVFCSYSQPYRQDVLQQINWVEHQ